MVENASLKIALVIPHIFMQDQVLPDVIFSPGFLGLDLAWQLSQLGHQVTLFTPGKVNQIFQKKFFASNNQHLEKTSNIDFKTADLSLFEAELEQRGYGYVTLLKKHPLTFITLARQVQAELIKQAYSMANHDKFDLVHVWCNEEELGLVFADLVRKPIFFTHHEPFSFLAKYRAIFPKYCQQNWIAISQNQKRQAKNKYGQFNFRGVVHHGLRADDYNFESKTQDFFLYFGRIIQPKGVHLAIQAAQRAGKKLFIAGKHYSGKKDDYWQAQVKPLIDGDQIKYLGFINSKKEKQKLLGQAQALFMPSTWHEPFGLVMIEALACGTPVIGFRRGALPEVIQSGQNGFLVDLPINEIDYKDNPLTDNRGDRLANHNEKKPQVRYNSKVAIKNLVEAIHKVKEIDRQVCRQKFEDNFTLQKMAKGYETIYFDNLRQDKR